MERNYIKITEFNDFCKNQETLINILNHRMTGLENEIMWIKRIGYYMAGIITLIAGKVMFI